MSATNEWNELFKEWKAGVDTGRSEGSRPRYDWMGIDGEAYRPDDGDYHSSSAPGAPPYGMTTDSLVRYQRLFTQYAANRLSGVGKEQYDKGNRQKFEDMSAIELVAGLREELADVVNYATMIDIRLQRMMENWSLASVKIHNGGSA